VGLRGITDLDGRVIRSGDYDNGRYVKWECLQHSTTTAMQRGCQSERLFDMLDSASAYRCSDECVVDAAVV
jgi:hypothetical protein